MPCYYTIRNSRTKMKCNHEVGDKVYHDKVDDVTINISKDVTVSKESFKLSMILSSVLVNAILRTCIPICIRYLTFLLILCEMVTKQ